MDCYNDSSIEEIDVLKAAQLGATECGINICAYTVGHDPCNMLYVMPNDGLAKGFSLDRLQKSLKNCPALKNLYLENSSNGSVVRFPGGTIRLVGAQSPAELSSWPIPRVVMDEVDKYPRWTGHEASPISLVEERTKNWPQRKILAMSTPTTEDGNIYQAYLNADVRYRYYVKCPYCGHWQTLVFEQLKFPRKHANSSDVRTSTYYECPSCKAKLYDKDKRELLNNGRWVAENQYEGKPKKVGFAINSLYSPWVSFGEVAAKFIESKDDPADLMNFVNSWLGEPWKSKAVSVQINTVLNQRTNLKAGIVPKWAKLLTGGVDCQQGYFYWCIRAWGTNLTSQKIACGQAITFGDVQAVMDNFWPVEDSTEKVQVVCYGIDTGYNTENVYDFCYNNFNIAIPIKGSSRRMNKRYTITPIEPGKDGKHNEWVQALNLYVIDTDQYKDFIMAHMAKPVGEPGAWQVDADTTREYAEQLCSEHKVVVTTGKYTEERWKQITSARPNHFLDCEVYAACAATLMNVRFLTDVVPKKEKPKEIDEGSIVPKEFTL